MMKGRIRTTSNRHQHSGLVLVLRFVTLLLCLSLAGGRGQASSQQQQQQEEEGQLPPQRRPTTTTTTSISNDDDDFLTTDSVVLITGAASYLGSELALALQRTYQPKKIILVDDLQQQKQQPSTMVDDDDDDDDIELLELKRKRLFQVLQEGAPGTSHLYRVDVRSPMVEFYDTARVPVLEHLFHRHSDITHIVHLANYERVDDASGGSSGSLLGPPREVITTGTPKAGMMESLLEQIYKHYYNNETTTERQRSTTPPPHFTYASSIEVYPRGTPSGDSGDDAWTEDSVLAPPQQQAAAVPSTWYGASRLLDEMLAQAYYDMHDDLYSVGLRFATVYGPGGADYYYYPSSSTNSNIIHLLARRAVVESSAAAREGATSPLLNNIRLHPDDARDYIYIDDAIDALLTAMQFRPSSGTSPSPVVFNVASGQTTSIQNIARHMEQALPTGIQVMPPKSEQTRDSFPPHSAVHVSIQRAQTWLGFQPRVSLDQGIQQILAWNYDQVHPYGLDDDGSKISSSSSFGAFSDELVTKGMAGCDPFDKECLRGVPVFPCASECSNKRQCLKSFWDEVLDHVHTLTAACPAVLYTVALLPSDADFLSTTNVQVSPQSQQSHMQDTNCNIAFVSEKSPIVERLQLASFQKARSTKSMDAANAILHAPLKYGQWTLVPVEIPPKLDLKSLARLSLLPKLSPGRFFSKACEVAIYIDSNVAIESVPNLLSQLEMRPTHPDYSSLNTQATMVIGKAKSSRKATTQKLVDGVIPEQQVAYRMFHIRAMEFFGTSEEDGFGRNIDSSFIVHRLQEEDSDDGRNFRCDVLSEILQWGDDYPDIAVKDESPFSFVMGRHDWWMTQVSSGSYTQKHETSPCWWRSEEARTIPVASSSGGGGSIAHRRLDEVEFTAASETKSTGAGANKAPKIQVVAVDETLDGTDKVEEQRSDKAFTVDGVLVDVGDASDSIGTAPKVQVLVDETSDVADNVQFAAGLAPVQVSDLHFVTGDETTDADTTVDDNHETDADDESSEQEDDGDVDVVSPEEHQLPPALTYDEDDQPPMKQEAAYDENGFRTKQVSVPVIEKEKQEGYKPITAVVDDDADDDKSAEGDDAWSAGVDPSEYDTWMAVRSSSTGIRSFVRLVPAEAVGVVRIDN